MYICTIQEHHESGDLTNTAPLARRVGKSTQATARTCPTDRPADAAPPYGGTASAFYFVNQKPVAHRRYGFL